MSNDLKKIVLKKRNLAVFRMREPSCWGAPAEQSADKAKNADAILSGMNAANPPVLIIHGVKDDLVPVAQSRRCRPHWTGRE